MATMKSRRINGLNRPKLCSVCTNCSSATCTNNKYIGEGGWATLSKKVLLISFQSGLGCDPPKHTIHNKNKNFVSCHKSSAEQQDAVRQPDWGGYGFHSPSQSAYSFTLLRSGSVLNCSTVSQGWASDRHNFKAMHCCSHYYSEQYLPV